MKREEQQMIDEEYGREKDMFGCLVVFVIIALAISATVFWIHFIHEIVK